MQATITTFNDKYRSPQSAAARERRLAGDKTIKYEHRHNGQSGPCWCNEPGGR